MKEAVDNLGRSGFSLVHMIMISKIRDAVRVIRI